MASGAPAAAAPGRHATRLGDVGLATRVGARHYWDPTIAGDHQNQPDQPQVMAFLPGLATLGDRHLLITTANKGREADHVQHQGRKTQAETLRDHAASLRSWRSFPASRSARRQQLRQGRTLLPRRMAQTLAAARGDLKTL
jgi:hypothetical protein